MRKELVLPCAHARGPPQGLRHTKRTDFQLALNPEAGKRYSSLSISGGSHANRHKSAAEPKGKVLVDCFQHYLQQSGVLIPERA